MSDEHGQDDDLQTTKVQQALAAASAECRRAQAQCELYHGILTAMVLRYGRPSPNGPQLDLTPAELQQADSARMVVMAAEAGYTFVVMESQAAAEELKARHN